MDRQPIYHRANTGRDMQAFARACTPTANVGPPINLTSTSLDCERKLREKTKARTKIQPHIFILYFYESDRS